MSFPIRIRAAGLIVHDDHILLNRFSKEGIDQYYNIVGGGLESGEQLRQAVQREVMEECGLTVDVHDVVFILEYEPVSMDQRYGAKYHLTQFFHCTLTGDSRLQETDLRDVNPDDATLVGVPEWVHVDRLLDIQLVPKVNKHLVRYIRTREFTPRFLTCHEV